MTNKSMPYSYILYIRRKANYSEMSLLSSLQKMLKQAFNSSTIEEFWRVWNPFINYFMLFYVYKSLKKILPQKFARTLTFLFSGFFVHDLPLKIIFNFKYPIFTVWFSLIAFFIYLEQNTNFKTISIKSNYIKNCIVLIGLFIMAIIPSFLFVL